MEEEKKGFWSKLLENSQSLKINSKKLLIKYYGWRVPVIGLFPNIVISNKTQFLDNMSRAEFCRFEAEKLIFNVETDCGLDYKDVIFDGAFALKSSLEPTLPTPMIPSVLLDKSKL